MWYCAKCGEAIEDQFDSCWKCAAAEPPPLDPKVPRRWLKLFGVGVLFEVIVILLPAVLPRHSWLFAKAFNFRLWSHYPLLSLLNAASPESDVIGTLMLVLAGLLMGVVWALLFGWGGATAGRLLERLPIGNRGRLLLVYGLGIVCLAIVAFAFIDASNNRPRAFNASPEAKSVVEGNTTFALDLYQKLKETPGNLVFSPYSISTALALTYAGARGQTETEMRETAHFNLPQDSLPSAFGELVTRMKKVQRWNRITLAVANSIWCDQHTRLTGSFQNLAQDRYQAEARVVDFAKNPAAACNEINHWVYKKTKGKITAVAKAQQFTPDTSLVLCSAIYFKGRWSVQFKASQTKAAPFFVATNQTVTVPMMYQKSDFKTADVQDPPIEMLELPYYGGDLSMVILLPSAADGLAELEKDLNPRTLRLWLAILDEASPHETSVHLPRFHTSQTFALKKTLESLGMPSAFNTNSDFSGIDGTKLLYISDAIHQASVDVSEEGTEAAATTMFQVSLKSMADRFNVNHPFLFLMRENGSGSILFLGRIVDPTK